MTGEINSAIQNLLPSTREVHSSSVNRPDKTQAQGGVEPGAKSKLQEAVTKVEENKEADKESLTGTISDLNQMVQQAQRELQFSIEEESGEMVVKVIDKETDEVIRQIPAQELLELRKRLADAAGAIFRDSV